MLKFTLNGKWFKNEMTNLGEYDVTQNTSLNLYQLNGTNRIFLFHFLF